MSKNIIFVLLSFSFFLSSCASPSPTSFSVTPGNVDEYLAPTHTPRPIPTPLPKNEGGEIVLLLRKRFAPFEVMILRLSNECLQSYGQCGLDGEILGVLPQSLSQVQTISWTKDGQLAFFWDGSVADIYILDGNQGTFQLFKKDVLKVRENFLFSLDGQEVMFEIQRNEYETDLVLMNRFSSEIKKFDLSISGVKHPSQWIDENVVLFWNEVNEGKGYLVDVDVYMLDVNSQSIQPFDIGRDWMQTSIPVFSPNRESMAFTVLGTVVVRDVSTGVESVVNISPEKILWSRDSENLVIYNQNKEIFTVSFDGNEFEKIYSLSENEYLEDWIWLPDNERILLIASDEDENRRVGVVSIVEKEFAPLNLSLLSEYDPVSFSFRP